MKIATNHESFSFITDNSSECDGQTAFLHTHLNDRYLEDAKNRNCAAVIRAEELKNHLKTEIGIVGICGTNGKTTTAAAIYSTLIDLGYKVALQGTRGFFINDKRVEEKGLTTPTLFDTYLHIDQAIREGCDYFIMEVSSHAIAQERIEGLEFILKVHTNLTSDHLDFHGTIENYHTVKNSFFADESEKIINRDDPRVKYSLKNTYTYGIENVATYKVNAYSLKIGIDAALQFANEQTWIHSGLFGLHNLYNLTAAFAAVHVLIKAPLEKISEAMENFGGVVGRMERVYEEPLVVIDFAHTEDGMRKAFESFSGKKIITVFGAGGDRDRSKRPLMGKVAERYAEYMIITNDNPRSEEPEIIAQDILDGIVKKEKAEVIIDRENAIKKALMMAQSGQVVLVLGKGDEEYMEIRGKKVPFSDKEIIQKLLCT